MNIQGFVAYDGEIMRKVQYLLRSIVKFSDSSSWLCPNCGFAKGQECDRKYFFTRLMRCDACNLMFRAPTDSEDFNEKFYNFFYKQGTSTQVPSDACLAQLLELDFVGSDRDYARYVALLKSQSIVPAAKIFDFGASWGYGSYQLARAGYDVQVYEIARDRRAYAINKLGMRHIDKPFAIVAGHPLYNSFDCFFSAHVLEHVPAPSRIIDLAWNCLRPGGMFVAVTPNGSDAYRTYDRQSWRRMWGGVHPNYLDDVFYNAQFARSKRQFVSLSGGGTFEESELAFVAFKNASERGF